MASSVRILMMGAIASLAACSAEDTSPATGGRDASVNLATGSGGALAGTGGTSNSETGGGGASSATAGSAGSSGGDGEAGSSSPSVDAEAPHVCLVAQYTHVSGFGSIFDGWSVATNSSPQLVTGMEGGSVAALDASDGSPANGSVKLTIPFSAVNQQLIFAQSLPAVNLTGTMVTAQIKLDSGLNTSPEHSGQAFLVLKWTDSYFYAPAAPINLDSSAGWITLNLDADAPLPAIPFGYTPCDVHELDVVIQTADMGTYGPAVVHIDTVAVTSKTTGDAGPDAAKDAAEGN